MSMLPRIRSLFTRGYSPVPSRPEDGASSPEARIRGRAGAHFTRGYSPLPLRAEEGACALEPRVPDRAGVARGTKEALVRWTGAIEHCLEKDPVLHRLDVAECLACALQTLEVRT